MRSALAREFHDNTSMSRARHDPREYLWAHKARRGRAILMAGAFRINSRAKIYRCAIEDPAAGALHWEGTPTSAAVGTDEALVTIDALLCL